MKEITIKWQILIADDSRVLCYIRYGVKYTSVITPT